MKSYIHGLPRQNVVQIRKKSPAAVICISTGDRAALLARRDELVASWWQLVRPIAERIKFSLPERFELDDLIGAGYVGLMTAATLYQPKAHRDTPFDAYARKRIRGSILDSVRRKNWIECSVQSIDGSPEPYEATHAEELLDFARRDRMVTAAIDALPERHRTLVTAYYQEGLKLSAIASRMGIGSDWASKLHVQAIQMLKERLLAA